MNCGCSEIVESNIEEWEKLYKSRYGHSYVKRDGNPYKRHIYRMTVQELKTELYERDNYREIMESIYPSFPKHFSRIDAVLLFFDKIIKEGELNKLRDILIEKHKDNGREEQDKAGKH